MNKHFLKLTAVFAVMFVSLACVFAGENAKPADFFSLDLKTASADEIINGFKQSERSFHEMRDELIATMNDAYIRRDASLYHCARVQYSELRYPLITEEQTQAILENAKSCNNTDLAVWLFNTSRFYNPCVKFVFNTDNCHYEQKLSVAPGTEFELPSFDIGGEAEFKGWSTESGTLSYKAGDKIIMPYDDTVLYAVFE